MARNIPKYFDGTQRTGLTIGEILPRLMADISRKVEDQRDAIDREWFLLIGEKMAPLTQPISFVEGVLTIKVKSSTLYSLLALHEKPALLKRLKEKFPIRNLVFKIG